MADKRKGDEKNKTLNHKKFALDHVVSFSLLTEISYSMSIGRKSKLAVENIKDRKHLRQTPAVVQNKYMGSCNLLLETLSSLVPVRFT